MKTAYIAFGGNLGDVRSAFVSARSQIAALPHTTVSNSSLLYRTPAIGPAGQPDYLNAAIAINTSLKPIALLDALQAIEAAHGRERKKRWGERTLDLDILAIDQKIISSKRLVLPHSQMFERQFVLRPLCDLAPEWQHPQLKQSALERLHEIITAGEKPLPGGEAW